MIWLTRLDQRLVTVASLTTVPYKGTLSKSVTKQILPERQTRQDFIGKLLISRYDYTTHKKSFSRSEHKELLTVTTHKIIDPQLKIKIKEYKNKKEILKITINSIKSISNHGECSKLYTKSRKYDQPINNINTIIIKIIGWYRNGIIWTTTMELFTRWRWY